MKVYSHTHSKLLQVEARGTAAMHAKYVAIQLAHPNHEAIAASVSNWSRQEPRLHIHTHLFTNWPLILSVKYYIHLTTKRGYSPL